MRMSNKIKTLIGNILVFSGLMLIITLIFFSVYIMIVEIGDYHIELDAVTIDAREDRHIRYVKTTDPWFSIFTRTEPEIVPE